MTLDVDSEPASLADKSPATLPEDIYNLLADDNDHEVSEENVQWAAGVFAELLRSRLTKRATLSGEDVLRFSSLGKKDRQIWYDANEPEKAEKLPGKVNLKFLIGDLWEVVLLFLAKESGHTVTDTQLEVEEDGVHGHIDAIIDGVLVDVKSASPYSFKKFVTGGHLFDDPFGYIAQLSGYAHKTRSSEAGWFVGEKVSGDLAYVPLDQDYIRGNDPKGRVAELRTVIRSPTPPPKCYDDEAEGKSGNRKLGVACSYCKHKENCWSDANGGKGLRKFFYSRGPVWLTHVAKEPNVQEADGATADA